MSRPEWIGRYRVDRLLGVGSFATVWLAYDPTLDGHVAIKVLAENWSHDLRVRERFLDEGRLLWRLDHERLVRVHAVDMLADGRPFLVMDWADGGSLRDRLGAGPLATTEAIHLLREIAAGVAVLHQHGIVHRDLAPGNVLLRTRGAPVVIADLGLAKSVAAASGLTARAGTPGFMAPEQDDPLATVDARADVYGLGRLGEALFRGTVQGPRVPVAGVLRTATARRPADRYADATAFGAALDAAVRARGNRGRRFARSGLVALLLITSGTLAGDHLTAPRGASYTVVDSSGRIAVTIPADWRTAGTGWAGQPAAGGGLEPAVVVSPDPARWPTDPLVPGAFVGLSRTIADRTMPAGYLAEHPHAECVAAPLRGLSRDGVDWVVATYTGCRTGKPSIVESAALAGDAGLLFVQIAPPPGSGPDFVNSLLGGIRVRAT